jgi:hypothetical protein
MIFGMAIKRPAARAAFDRPEDRQPLANIGWRLVGARVQQVLHADP